MELTAKRLSIKTPLLQQMGGLFTHKCKKSGNGWRRGGGGHGIVNPPPSNLDDWTPPSSSHKADTPTDEPRHLIHLDFCGKEEEEEEEEIQILQKTPTPDNLGKRHIAMTSPPSIRMVDASTQWDLIPPDTLHHQTPTKSKDWSSESQEAQTKDLNHEWSPFDHQRANVQSRELLDKSPVMNSRTSARLDYSPQAVYYQPNAPLSSSCHHELNEEKMNGMAEDERWYNPILPPLPQPSPRRDWMHEEVYDYDDEDGSSSGLSDLTFAEYTQHLSPSRQMQPIPFQYASKASAPRQNTSAAPTRESAVFTYRRHRLY